MEGNPQNLQAPATEGKGSAVASLVLGILSIVFAAVPFLNLILAIVGVALAHNALQRGYQGGMRTAGSILSIIGLIFSAILMVLMFAAGIFAARSLNLGAYFSSLLSSAFSSL